MRRERIHFLEALVAEVLLSIDQVNHSLEWRWNSAIKFRAQFDHTICDGCMNLWAGTAGACDSTGTNHVE